MKTQFEPEDFKKIIIDDEAAYIPSKYTGKAFVKHVNGLLPEIKKAWEEE